MLTPYLAGLLFGDGTSHIRYYMVWIDQHERNTYIVEKAKSILESLNLKVYYYGFLNKKRAAVNSKELYYEFKELKNDPSKFFEYLSNDEKKEFIAGFFDAEGTVTDRLVVYNQNIELLKSIKKFFDEHGITSYIYKFGKVYGVQIYRRKDIKIINEMIPSLKMRHSILPS